MPNLNLCQFIGNLGRDPELRYTPGGQSIVDFSLAVNRRYLKDGDWQEETEWVRVVAWGDLAERVADAEQTGLRRGMSAYVQGRLQTRQWEDQDGNKKYMTEIVAQAIQRLTPYEKRANAQPKASVDEFGDEMAF